jgi:hypothetical protein
MLTQKEEYSTIKNKIMFFAGKWVQLEIMLSKICHFQKDKCHVFSHVESREKKKVEELY